MLDRRDRLILGFTSLTLVYVYGVLIYTIYHWKIESKTYFKYLTNWTFLCLPLTRL